jgi:hypothetical protein
MPNELKDIEVEEVSLVDRPATGKRFVLFKRCGLLRKGADRGEANICSEAGAETPVPETQDFALLQKRADDAEAEIARLNAHSASLEERLEAVEKARAPRQSEEADPPAASLWAGIL